MSDQDKITVSGRVLEISHNTIWVEVAVGSEKKKIKCYPSGKIRKNSIMILAGDLVDIELSPYDLYTGRVTYRHREAR